MSKKVDRIIQKNGLKKELFLLKPFIKEPTRAFTIAEIKQISQNKSHHYVFEALKRFTQMQILTEKNIFTQNEFFEMLTNDQDNIAKQLAKNHTIVYGAEMYYKILFEAIKHGFK